MQENLIITFLECTPFSIPVHCGSSSPGWPSIPLVLEKARKTGKDLSTKLVGSVFNLSAACHRWELSNNFTTKSLVNY